jgi:hypothetical protein
MSSKGSERETCLDKAALQTASRAPPPAAGREAANAVS